VRYAQLADEEETYADVAVLPNIDRSGTVLIFNSIGMLGVEAAGELAMRTSPGLSAGRFSEILLRIRSIGGTVSKSEVVAVRDVYPGVIEPPRLAAR
jgi:hypothetical protein